MAFAFGYQIFTQDAYAAYPRPGTSPLEVELPEFIFNGSEQAIPWVESNSFAMAAKSSFGGYWNIFSDNYCTWSPIYIYGSSDRSFAASSLSNSLGIAAQRIINQSAATFFNTVAADFVIESTVHANEKWAFHFKQEFRGLRVWGGRAVVVFSEDGKLILIGGRVYRDIAVDISPTLSKYQAADLVKAELPFDSGTDYIEEDVDLLVLPYPQSANQVRHHLVYRFRIHTSDPLGIWVTHVDAHSGRVLWRHNDIHFDYLGTTATDVRSDTYCNGSAEQPVPYLHVIVGGLMPTTTDSSGNWLIPGNGDSRGVVASLFGPYVDLNNAGGAEALFRGSALDGVPLPIVFSDQNSQKDERDVFSAVNNLHNLFQVIDPEFQYAQQRILANVSLDGYYCPGNAWWDGAINFCSAGDGFANTGEIQSIIYHEYGHGVQDAILGWQGSEGLGEGNADILANLMTQDPIFGRGYYLGECTSGIRSSENTLLYPFDVQGQEPHQAGQVIAGFNWDAMVLLQAVHGLAEGTRLAAENWHHGRVLLQPTTQPEQVFATFFADDDDGDLSNGTPNYEIYCEAAANHNFTCPEILVGVMFSHIPLSDTTENEEPYIVEAAVFSSEAEIDPASVRLFYRYGDGIWLDQQMMSTGANHKYLADIAPIPTGKIDYYIYAEDMMGNTGTLPGNAPEECMDFLVAWYMDEAEEPGNWEVGAPDDDATAGIWENVDPYPTVAQPGDDHSVYGSRCWITGQHVPGESESAYDVDNGKTTLFSPVYDLAEFSEVIIRYWKWYSNNQGFSPNNDFWDVDISNDGGASWAAVEHTNISTNCWVSHTFELSDYYPTPGRVQLRFVAADEGGGSMVEAGVDDLILVALSETTPVPGNELEVRLVTELNQNAPNPFNPRTTIEFNLERAGQVRLRIYDVMGRLVRTLVDRELDVGGHQVVWDGKTEKGLPVSGGVYLYYLETENFKRGRRMLLVR